MYILSNLFLTAIFLLIISFILFLFISF